MKTERRYLARFDDGREYHFITFESEARKGSAQNAEDARTAARHQTGKAARYWKLLSIEREECY